MLQTQQEIVCHPLFTTKRTRKTPYFSYILRILLEQTFTKALSGIGAFGLRIDVCRIDAVPEILWSSNNVDFMAGHPPHPNIHPQEIRPYYNLMSGKGKTLQGVG